MEADALFQLLSSVYPLSESFLAALRKELMLLSLPKNHMLLEAPKVGEYIYFLQQGFALTYSYEAGEKQINGFWKSGQIILPTARFFEQLPSSEYIQLMEKSDVLFLHHSKVEELLVRFPEAQALFRVLMNRHHQRSLNCNRELRHLSVEVRFEKLRKRYPSLEQLVPQENIASYLGITPQSLSRLKRRQRGH